MTVGVGLGEGGHLPGCLLEDHDEEHLPHPQRDEGPQVTTLPLGDLRGAEHRQEVPQGCHGGEGEQRVSDSRSPLTQQRLEPDDEHSTNRDDSQGPEHHPAPLTRGERIGNVKGEVAQLGTTMDESHEGQGHTDGCRDESDVVPVVVLEQTGDERSDEGADVDRHVEVQEALVTTRIAIVIEATDDRRQIRLDETGTDGDADKADPRRHHLRYRQDDVTGHDDETAPQGGDPRPENPVGEDTAGNRHEQHRSAIGGHHHLTGIDRQPEAAICQGVGDEVNEDGPHPEPGEPLPHFHLEHPRQTAGMTKE